MAAPGGLAASAAPKQMIPTRSSSQRALEETLIAGDMGPAGDAHRPSFPLPAGSFLQQNRPGCDTRLARMLHGSAARSQTWLFLLPSPPSP